jgi:hypothetical protein
VFEQKLRPTTKQKKTKRQHGAAFYVIGVFTFAIESMLGINAAFLVDQSIAIVARNMLEGTFLAPLASFVTLIVSLAVGFSFVAGGMWTFSGFMESLDDARAYRDTYGTNHWPVIMVWALVVAVIILDFTTLMFRAAFFAEKGASALLAFFVVLIFLPPILGALVHVLENTPRDRRLSKARQYAEQLEGDSVAGLVETMDEDLRSRWLSGDVAAVDEHYQRVDSIREDARLYEEAQMLAREEQKRAKQEQKRAKQEQKAQSQRPLPTVRNPFQRHPKSLTALPQQQAQQSGQDNQRRA